uniref:Uncharacterized protein n=1 Tax=uncultured Desulfobacterium sp. TaxID=201089 RepID=E1YFM5_9BACT|nr:unknown protein [uncultured Desulfobacterium sp.]CBX30541.1 unknown protein [uncultured Desulfobacterium sp.]
MIGVVLPIRRFDCDAVIALIDRIQKKNYRAYLSHRKKRLGQLVKT